MPTGGCYCGEVRYEFEGELGPLVNCHCRFCRRAHGAAFITAAMLPSATFRFTRGEPHVLRYGSGEGYRVLCSLCGGRLYNQPASTDAFVMLLVSTLDEEPTVGPVIHINVESKAPWYEIRDELPQFSGLPPAASDFLGG